MISKITNISLNKINNFKHNIGCHIVGVSSDTFSIGNAMREKLMTEKLLKEMEEYVNSLLPNAKFCYSEMYKKCNSNPLLINSEWELTKGKFFIEESMDYLKKVHNVTNLLPFASDKQATRYACFLIDNKSNDKVVVIYPFATKENLYQGTYKNIEDWINNGLSD